MPTRLIAECPVIFFDTETTGLDPAEGAEVVEMAVVQVSDDIVVAEGSWLVKPQRPIPAKLTEIHGITNEMVEKSLSFRETWEGVDGVLAPVKDWIPDNAVIVAHNAPFDMKFLAAELARAGLPAIVNTWLDNLDLSRREIRQVRNAQLGTLAERLSIKVEGAHRALADCHVLRQIWLSIMKNWKGNPPTVLDVAKRSAGMLSLQTFMPKVAA